MEDNIYVHYGSNKFDKYRFKPIKNITSKGLGWLKPDGGLWASNQYSTFGWYDWIHANEFMLDKYKDYFCFKLNTNKILMITKASQLRELPQISNCEIDFLNWIYLDFEKLAEQYDAMEVIFSNDFELQQMLSTWDCDSLLVFNPDVIEEIDV